MTPHPIVRPVGSIIGSEKDFGGMCSCISCRFLIRSVSCLSRLPTWSFFSGILPGEVPRVDRDGSAKFHLADLLAARHNLAARFVIRAVHVATIKGKAATFLFLRREVLFAACHELCDLTRALTVSTPHSTGHALRQ